MQDTLNFRPQEQRSPQGTKTGISLLPLHFDQISPCWLPACDCLVGLVTLQTTSAMLLHFTKMTVTQCCHYFCEDLVYAELDFLQLWGF